MASPRAYFIRDPEGKSFALVERTVEPLMLVLSLSLIPVLIAPFLADLSDEARASLELAGQAIWVTFVVEYLWLLYLAPNRWQMVRSHKLDLLIVLLPFLRPLRFLQFLRLASTASGVGRAIVAVRRIGSRPGFRGFFGATSVVMTVSAGFALAFEHEQPGASIQNYSDALWWAFVTCTTVGYGDHFPVTTGGQIVAAVLMLLGIAGLSLLTASIAAMFVEEDDKDEMNEIRAQLDRIEAKLESRS